jgi:hypothetical protein
VWIAGLVSAFRRPRLRLFGWAWVLLAVAFMATGGKPYYLGGLLPLLTGLGAVPTDRWLAGHRRRRRLLIAAVLVSAVVCGIIALPVLPRADLGPVLAANPDAGETVGWPAFVRTVARVDAALGTPPDVVVLAANYGEAGAVDRFGAAYGLPRAVSGHNAYGYWGPPAPGAGPVIVVGYRLATAERHLTGCRPVARIRTGVDNDENGGAVLVCLGPRTSWAREWPGLRHLG